MANAISSTPKELLMSASENPAYLIDDCLRLSLEVLLAAQKYVFVQSTQKPNSPSLSSPPSPPALSQPIADPTVEEMVKSTVEDPERRAHMPVAVPDTDLEGLDDFQIYPAVNYNTPSFPSSPPHHTSNNLEISESVLRGDERSLRYSSVEQEDKPFLQPERTVKLHDSLQVVHTTPQVQASRLLSLSAEAATTPRKFHDYSHAGQPAKPRDHHQAKQPSTQDQNVIIQPIAKDQDDSVQPIQQQDQVQQRSTTLSSSSSIIIRSDIMEDDQVHKVEETPQTQSDSHEIHTSTANLGMQQLATLSGSSLIIRSDIIDDIDDEIHEAEEPQSKSDSDSHEIRSSTSSNLGTKINSLQSLSELSSPSKGLGKGFQATTEDLYDTFGVVWFGLVWLVTSELTSTPFPYCQAEG